MELARRHCSDADENMIGTKVQKRKNIQCTKTKKIEEKDITLNSLNNIIKVTSTKIETHNEAHVLSVTLENYTLTKLESFYALLELETNV